MSDVDWKGVGLGAVVTIAVGVLASVAAAATGASSSKHHDSNLIFIFFWLDVIGAAAGGYIAARRRLDAPMLHGALVGAVGYVVVAVFATTITLVSGNPGPDILLVISGILWLALGGTIGGWIASWRAQRTRPSTDS